MIPAKAFKLLYALDSPVLDSSGVGCGGEWVDGKVHNAAGSFELGDGGIGRGVSSTLAISVHILQLDAPVWNMAQPSFSRTQVLMRHTASTL